MLWDGLALVQGAVTPYLLNPTAANLKGKTAWITCGINVLILIYGYFRLPETRGRSTDELDMMFSGCKSRAREEDELNSDTHQ